MKMIFSIIATILSYSPVLSITDDNNFGTIEKTNRNNIGCTRFSLFQIMCGACKAYLFTWIKVDEKIVFKIVKIVTLKHIFSDKGEDINLNCSKYKDYLDTVKKEQVLIEKEDLCYHIDSEKKRIETSNTKINTYMTIFLTVIPIVISLGNWKSIWDYGLSTKCAIIFLLFLVGNIVLYIFSYIKVDSYKRYRFSELKVSQENVFNRNKTFQKRNGLLYSDWQHIRNEAELKVSYVLNLQKWIVVTFVFVVVLLLVA